MFLYIVRGFYFNFDFLNSTPTYTFINQLARHNLIEKFRKIRSWGHD